MLVIGRTNITRIEKWLFILTTVRKKIAVKFWPRPFRGQLVIVRALSGAPENNAYRISMFQHLRMNNVDIIVQLEAPWIPVEVVRVMEILLILVAIVFRQITMCYLQPHMKIAKTLDIMSHAKVVQWVNIVKMFVLTLPLMKNTNVTILALAI
jgi:hypothetical protein